MLIVTISSVSVAAPLNYVPTGERIDHKGTTYECFDLPKYKLLLDLDNEHSGCVQRADFLALKVMEYEKIVGNFDQIISLNESSLSLLTAENQRLFELWKKENQARHLAENNTNLYTNAAWITAGGFAILSGIFAGILLSD